MRIILIVSLIVASSFWIARATTVPHLADNIVAVYLVAWGMAGFLSSVSRKELGKRFTLMTLTIGCLLLSLEAPAALGLMDYRQVFSITEGFDTWDKPGFVAAEEVLWVHRPHYRTLGTFSKGDVGKALCAAAGLPQTFDLRYDRNGFRNETDLASADIVVIGDSFVESPIVPTAALATSVLGELVNNKVANLGISGFGPQQELGVLKRYALTLNPKTVLWFFYEGNDLEDTREYDGKAARWPKARPAYQKELQRSFSRNALWALLRSSRGCVPSAELRNRYGIFRDKQGIDQRVYFAYPATPLSAGDLEALEKTKSILAEAYRLCRERGIRLVVVFGPTEFRVYRGLQNLADVSEEVKKWVVNDLPDRLGTAVADISPEIGYVDLTQSLRSEAARGTQVFLKDDTHWSPDGHKIVAETMHKMLSGQLAVAK